MPNPYVSAINCDFRYISRTNLKANIWANFSQPTSGMMLHIVGNYKFNGITYNQMGPDFWLDVCEYLEGKSKYAFIVEWTFGKVIRKYSNFNHTCPYEGQLFLRFDNVSTSMFGFDQILPSGRFRVDTNITDSTRKIVIVKLFSFVSVSDSRVELF